MTVRDRIAERSEPTRPRRAIVVEPFVAQRAAAAKISFVTRRVPSQAMEAVITGAIRPRSGDLVLATVEKLGHHTKLELVSGRRASLHLGDEIVVAYADRYAPDQFESRVPVHLGRTDLVASGGIASSVEARHRRVRAATRIRPVGLIGTRQGVAINVRDYAIGRASGSAARPPTIAVLGTSMNSGKTTIARFLVNGLSRAGRRPGATKVTGTGSGNDYWQMVDAGAHRAADFTDAGYASTYRIPMYDLEAAFEDLICHLAAAGCDSIVIEVADGIFQQETSQLIASPVFKALVDIVIFAAPDAMGAAHGAAMLARLGLDPAAIGGVLTSSPLATREAEEACSLPILATDDFGDPAVASALLVGADLPPRAMPRDEAESDLISPYPIAIDAS
jgi:hypothetical protein